MIVRPALILLLLAVAGCSTTAQDEFDPPLPPKPAASPVDPRVSDLQITVNELLDRVEVLQARVHELERREPPAQTVRTASVPPPSRPATTGGVGSEAPSSGANPAPPASRAVKSADIANRYRDALALYGKGALDQARRAFQKIFDDDPSGELADNALYWIGETYFTTGKYGEAIGFFERIEADYADQNKAPDAIFKIGASLAKQGDLALARRTYQRLIEKYPYSTPAAAARVELKRIRY